MLKRWIIALRRQPKAARNRVALIVAASFTAVILLIWLATLPLRFSHTDVPTTDVFGSFGDTISNEISNLRETLPVPAATTSTSANEVATGTVSTSETTVVSASSTATTSVPERTVLIATTSASTTNTQPTP